MDNFERTSLPILFLIHIYVRTSKKHLYRREVGTTNMIVTQENHKRTRPNSTTATAMRIDVQDEIIHIMEEEETYIESEEEGREEEQSQISNPALLPSSKLFSPMMLTLNQSLSASSPSFREPTSDASSLIDQQLAASAATYSTPRLPYRHIMSQEKDLSPSIHSTLSSCSTTSSMDVPPTRMDFGTSFEDNKTMTSYSSSSSSASPSMTPIGQEDISLTKSLSRKKLRQEDESIESDEHYFLTSDEEYQVEQEQDGGNHETSQELNGEGNELDEEKKLLYL